ncbi:uncharacterized protein LOC116536802 [Sapajus apella]|uniref:Uncharacterized protein LOC116536802 n=1 Tax=Sapajus apella TaxID=9515 RepID=A0A6J3G9K9_SAPAP|nr:uncharacterized protein LOC116536802 [Sapajus apella]
MSPLRGVLRSAGRSRDSPSFRQPSLPPARSQSPLPPQSQSPLPPQVLPFPKRMKLQLQFWGGLDPSSGGSGLPIPLVAERHFPGPSYQRSAESGPDPCFLLGSQGHGWVDGLTAGLLAQWMLSSPGAQSSFSLQVQLEGQHTTRPSLQLAPPLQLRGGLNYRTQSQDP